MDQAVCLHQTPMFHDNSLGALLAAPCAGGVTTFVASFEPGDVLDVTERDAVTMSVMVPTMIAMMLAHPSSGPGVSPRCRRSPTAHRRCPHRFSTSCSGCSRRWTSSRATG